MSALTLGIDENRLVAVGNGHFLHETVVEPFFNMQKAAKADGVDIQVCSSYRNFEKQLSIWNRKFGGELPLYSLSNTQLNHEELSDEQKVHAIMLWSALPGASRHHWGTDFDVYDKASVEALNHDFQLVPSEYEPNGVCGRLNTWIVNNGEHFGFYFPYAKFVGGVAREPWHMSFKKLAISIENDFDIAELYNHLERSELLGKETVLKMLPELVYRYTLNRGKK